jgi:hypothetical protein
MSLGNGGSTPGSPTPNRDFDADVLDALKREYQLLIDAGYHEQAAPVAEQLRIRGYEVR